MKSITALLNRSGASRDELAGAVDPLHLERTVDPLVANGELFGRDVRIVHRVQDERRSGHVGEHLERTASVDFDLVTAGGVKSVFFGDEGLFFARLTGPGRVWIQSLPLSRLARRMLAAAGSRGGQNRGEGSILGGLGDLVGGND